MKSTILLFIKSRIGPYLRGGRIVAGYDRAGGKQAKPGAGQLALFISNDAPEPGGPNPFKGKDPVAATPDLFGDDSLLEGFPAGAKFCANADGHWAVCHADGELIGNYMRTKREAAGNARQFLEADSKA
jgi:hypothetical protein